MERFFEKVDKTTNCWKWKAALRGKSGYGAFKLNGKVMDAHRVSYVLHKGEIPENMFVCHTCDDRLCVNPEHLFLGTAKQNWQDAVDKGRIKPLVGVAKHPSKGSYARGCRCEECKAINTEMVRKYRLRKRTKNVQ